MMLDEREQAQKLSVVSYLQSLVNGELEIPYYNLKRHLELNEIGIEHIVFESSDEKNLTVLSVSDLNANNSVAISISEKSWIEYLPSIYKENKELKSFLYGIQVSMFQQKELIDHIEDIFIPKKSDFLDWLASWYGVGFSSSVQTDSKRELIYKLIELYKKRGTKEYLIEMVKILTGKSIEIRERVIPDYLQKNDDFMGEEYNLKITFTVKILDNNFENEEEEKFLIKKIKNILEKEKPAFTEYYIDADLIAKENESMGIDMHSDEEPTEFFMATDDEPEVNHFEYEKEEIKEEKKQKPKVVDDDDDDDFFSYD